jgi:hypothetical protein
MTLSAAAAAAAAAAVTPTPMSRRICTQRIIQQILPVPFVTRSGELVNEDADDDTILTT